MAPFNCIFLMRSAALPLCLLLFPPTDSGLRPLSQWDRNPGKARQYQLDLFHGRRCVSLLIVGQPASLLLPLCLLWPVCLLVYFRRFPLKTELLCQDIAVFCNVAGPRCQKPAEINHRSVLFTTGCERVWNPPSVTSFKGAVRHFQCRVRVASAASSMRSNSNSNLSSVNCDSSQRVSFMAESLPFLWSSVD